MYGQVRKILWKKVAKVNNLLNHSFSAYDELPITMTDEEHLKGKIKQQINLRVGPVDGFASHYDYENNRWKSMPWTIS